MRVLPLALALSLAAGCTREPPPPTAPPAEAPAETASEEPIEAPRQPTAAFAPTSQGACPRAYRLLEDTCVHRTYQPTSEPALTAALAAYKRGAAPPMLGPAPLQVAVEPAPSKKPDPGALMRKSATSDAGSAKDQRLAELDAMLAIAREKLRQRDEAARAKKVENAPRMRGADASGDDREALDRFARSMGGAGSGGGLAQGTAGDPTAARMGELSQIANQLSGPQLEALRAELSKSGFNADAFEAILSEARK